MAILALGLSAGVCQAAPITYTYNSSVSNWYTTGWTATCNLGGGYIQTNTGADYLNQIRVDEPGGVSNIPSVIWSGAQWVAPAGQNITSVTLTYSGIIKVSPNLTVYAGTSAADTKVFTNPTQLIWDGTTATLTFSPTSQYRYLTVRNWDFGDVVGGAVAAGWYSTVSDISITVPEPVSLSLLALGGCFLLRRRR